MLGDEKELMAKYTNADLETKIKLYQVLLNFLILIKRPFNLKETIQFISNFDGACQ